MRGVVRDCLVSGFEDLVEAIHLPDLDDRHVVAAAIRCGAQTIVTFNLADFPLNALAPFGLEAQHPDAFVLDAIDLAPGAVCVAVSQQVASLKNPPRVSVKSSTRSSVPGWRAVSRNSVSSSARDWIRSAPDDRPKRP
jgi:hypothetical protein